MTGVQTCALPISLITMHLIQRATILSEKFLNFPIQFSNVTQKKMSQKTFDYQLLNRTAKNPIFSTISFAAIMFLKKKQKQTYDDGCSHYGRDWKEC